MSPQHLFGGILMLIGVVIGTISLIVWALWKRRD